MSAPTLTPDATKAAPFSSRSTATLPQVNLLPPEVRSARTLSRVKRWLGMAIGLTLVVILLLVGYAAVQERMAQSDLAREQQVTEQLLAEQQQYSEVPLVLAELERVNDARKLGMSTEILWRDYLNAIVAVTPDSVTIESVAVNAASPIEPAREPASVLVVPGVGDVTFSGRSETLPDTATWIEALDSIPGLRDAWVQTAEVSGTDDEVYYEVVSTVQLDTTAFAERFVDGPEVDATTEDEGEA